MRKMFSSGNAPCRVWLRARAEARSRPKGFSTTTRACSEQPGRALRVLELGLEPAEGRGIAVVAVHVAELGRQLREGLGVEAPVFRHAGFRPLDELRPGPARLGHPHHREVQPAPAHQRLQGREDLLVGQVSGGAEEDEGVGWRSIRRFHFFSTWPPKPNRMADCTLFWKRSRPREAKRSNSEA